MHWKLKTGIFVSRHQNSEHVPYNNVVNKFSNGVRYRMQTLKTNGSRRIVFDFGGGEGVGGIKSKLNYMYPLGDTAISN